MSFKVLEKIEKKIKITLITVITLLAAFSKTFKKQNFTGGITDYKIHTQKKTIEKNTTTKAKTLTKSVYQIHKT